MTNRLLQMQHLRGLLLMLLLPLAWQARAQSPFCEDPGDLYTLNYQSLDTIYVGANCAGSILSLPSVGSSPAAASLVFNSQLTGYSLGSMIPGGTMVTVHYIAENSNGSISDTLCILINFLDTIPPQVNYTVQNVLVSCEMENYAGWIQSQMDSLTLHSTDNCGGAIDTVYHSGPAVFPGNCAVLPVTFSVADATGNVTTLTATYQVTDNVKPELQGVPPGAIDSIYASCGNIPPPYQNVTATDNCAQNLTPSFFQASTQINTPSDPGFYNYTLIRTWTVNDGCGNLDIFRSYVFVSDSVAPQFNVPADTVVVCGTSTDAASLGGVTNITDNCATVFTTTTWQDTLTNGNDCHVRLRLRRFWAVADPSNNRDTLSQLITVIDTLPPTAVFPADITISCSTPYSNLNLTGMPSQLADNCGTPVLVDNNGEDNLIPGNCAQGYTVQRTWKVTDGCDTLVHVQLITVLDTLDPKITTLPTQPVYACSDTSAAVFNVWIATHGGASAFDNCTTTANLVWQAFASGTGNPAVLLPADCQNPITGVSQRAIVDFVVYDECGNTDTTTATFTIADTTPPMLADCPQDRTVAADAGDCAATLTLPLPFVMEACGNIVTPVNLSQTKTLAIPQGSDVVETPVNDVVYNFQVQGPPYKATDDGSLTIALNSVDAEEPTEFFLAYGENNVLLGQVAHTAIQCGDTSSIFIVTAAQINDWAADGVLKITLRANVPANLPGRYSINPICPGNSVTASLAYETNFPGNTIFEYSVNSGTRIAVSPIAPLTLTIPQGDNAIAYYFTDCAGNQDSCTFNVTVTDDQGPVISCPQDIVLTLDPGQCNRPVEIPLFSSITDNCGVTNPFTETQPEAAADRLLTFTYNPNLNDYLADDRTFVFSDLEGNATPGGVQLILTFQADVDSVGEYFEVYDQDGNLLGTTASGQPHVTPGDCNTPGTAVFTIPANTFNAWAAAGDIQIVAQSYAGYPIPPAGPGWGINPCDTALVQNDGDTDGTSFLYATFSYQSVTPLLFATGATPLDTVILTPPLNPATYTLSQGTTTFTYQLDDLAGNTGSCSFSVTVNDLQSPTALCGPTFIEINPSGITATTISPDDIDTGSSDNCGIASRTVTPNTFECDDASMNPHNVILTVTDSSGNVSTCATFVNVSVLQPAPTATSDCGSSILQLFANPPAAPGGGSSVYQYVWRNPQGIAFAFIQNPLIQDADAGDLGFYTVTIEGLTGCESTGSVQVTCDILPLGEPVVQAADNTLCSSEMVQLTTQPVCGTTVQYKWYSGTAPGTLMGTTLLPSFSMQPPAAGTFTFYVVVNRNGCDSPASDPVTVQVAAAPVATPEQTSLVLCAGESIALNSLNNLPGSTCQWTGPCGYQSSSCSPAPIVNASDCNSGFYQLTVTRNGCTSEPAVVAVTVVPQPAQPVIVNSTSAANPACNGESVTLTAAPVAGAVSYLWTSPLLTTIPTPTNELFIANADITKDAGQWTVKVIGNPCESLVSAPVTVYMSPSPEGITAAATPSDPCEGQDVILSASSASQNVSYLWTYPDGNTYAQQNPTVENVTLEDDGDYILTISNQFGCSAAAIVKVDVLDRVEITALSNNAPGCASGPVNVQLVPTLFPMDTAGTYVYEWTGPGTYTSADAVATIPNAVFGNSGTYTLVVTNANGCSSLPVTTTVDIPQVLNTPGVPQGLSNPYCEGESVTLTTAPFQGTLVNYVWHTPTGNYTTGIPSFTIDNLTLADAGAYSVRYTANDCTSDTSATVTLIVNAAPVILPGTNSPVCESDVLQFSLECTPGATYEWTGPGGFSSSICNPVIPNADPSLHSGVYSVRKNVNGCWSEVTAVNVTINEQPAIPAAINAGPYCANDGNVVLSVSAGSATPGASYTWYNANGDSLGTVTSLNFTVPNPEQYGEGAEEFYVVASLQACPATASVPTQVMLNTIPANQAEAGANVNTCQGEIVLLQATEPTAGTGIWSLVSGNSAGVVIANPDEAGTTVSGLTPGAAYVFQWSLSNGACTDYSTDTVLVLVDVVEAAEAGAPVVACFSGTATLNATAPLSNNGVWTQPAAQAALGVVIADPASPSTSVSGLVAGNEYIFTWTIDGGCGTSSDMVVVTATNETAFAGDDFEECGSGCAQLTAETGEGQWVSLQQGPLISSPNSPATAICNLLPGDNIFVWTVSGGACGHFSVDSVVVSYQPGPVPADDAVTVTFDTPVTFDVTENDELPENYTVEIAEQPVHGELTLDQNGLLTYVTDVNFAGADSAVYRICQQDCECVSATIYFTVSVKTECVPPSIITPNGDGVNDAFVVPCLADLVLYGNSALGIYNQWGDEVFHAEPYLNNWEGTFDGESLPAGTYFYLLDPGTGEDPMSGYLILQR